MRNTRLQKNTQKGFIALISAIIISAILLGFTATVGSSSFHSRFDTLNSEFKRVSLGLAESCINSGLLEIAQNYYFGDASKGFPLPAGGKIVSVGVDSNGNSEECIIKSVIYTAEDPLTHQKIATITASGEYNNAYSSVSTSATVLNPSVTVNRAGLFVVTQFINDNSGSLGASASTISVTGGGTVAPYSSFKGSELGVIVTVDANAVYSVDGNTVTGYTSSQGSFCSGTMSKGEVETCVITYNDTPTTGNIYVTTNIINDNGGIKTTSDFPLYIDGTQVANGIPNEKSAGTYNISGGSVSDYSITTETGYCGSITLNVGDNKTCTITYDDNPPPTPECADTVMMLDRTGSMQPADLAGEKTAANSLLDLYDNLSPAPKASVGVFGAVGANEPYLASIIQGLTSTYSLLYSALNTGLSSKNGSTNLQSAIQKAQDELSTHGSFHADGTPFERVLILLSDGGANRPNATTVGDTTFKSPTLNSQNANGDNWNTPDGVYGTGDANDASGHRHQFSTLGLNVPSNATITGLEVNTDAWSTSTNDTPNLLPTSIGDFTQWIPNGTTTDFNATNDSNESTFIDTATSTITHTFKFPKITNTTTPSIPTNATIVSINLNIQAKSTIDGSIVQFVEEQGASSILLSPNQVLTTTPTLYSYPFTTKPDGITKWKPADLNPWLVNFGVRTYGGNPVQVLKMYLTVTYY